MARYVEQGVLDAGITGYDWIIENNAQVHEVCELMFSKVSRRPVRWVLCVPEDSPVKSVKDLQGKRIATGTVELTKQFLDDNGITAEVEFSWGPTEVKQPYLADAIVEVTETGSSLKANNLRIIHEVMRSTTQLIANKAAWADPWKKSKIARIAMLLKAALNARGKVGLMLNVQEKDLAAVEALLPSLRSPTVSKLQTAGWYAVSTIVDEETVRELLPRLKESGAEGIVEFPLNKIVD